MDGWVKYYLKIILSFGFNLLGVPDKMGLLYEVWMVGQITQKKDIKLTSRHFPVIVLTSWSEASRKLDLSQIYGDISQSAEHIVPAKVQPEAHLAPLFLCVKISLRFINSYLVLSTHCAVFNI